MSDSDNEVILNNVLTPTGPARFAKLTLPDSKKFGAMHPFNNKPNHNSLLTYLQQRLYAGMQKRDENINRMVQIDRAVAGWMQLTDSDKDRQDETNKTGVPIAVDVNLPLTFVHLDDMMTYFAQTFAPTQGMFYQTGKKDEQDSAAQIVTIMNNHAIYAGYFRETLQGIYNTLKYNVGGFKVNWSKDYGPKLSQNAQGVDVVSETLRWQGNRIESLDMYNLMFDPSVHPSKLHCDGEFAAVAKVKSHHWLQRRAMQGAYFNCDAGLKQDNGMSQWTFYRSPPQEAIFSSDRSGGTDWKAILSGTTETPLGAGYELVEMEIILNPTEFGLIQGPKPSQAARDRLETWRFTILNNTWIISADYMNNIHGMLPYFLGLYNDDLMSTAQKSAAEILNPLQTFASSLLNTHVKGNRKNLFGAVYYDPSAIDLGNVPEGEVAVRIPLKPAAWGKDIRSFVFKDDSQPGTQQTMEDLMKVMDIFNQFFPTQSLPSQIAQIDRAVTNQVAAVQQGANRRQQKAARLLDETLFRNMRFVMYYNIIQYQPNESEVSDYINNKTLTVNLDTLRSTDLPFIIGQGLKAIDRQATAQALQQLIFALIQAPAAGQQFDLPAMIDFWSSYIDVDADLSQFRIQAPVAAQPGAGAAAGAVGADGNPIQPVTDPSKVTAPIYS